ncbi:PhzF family phenazine biosynthesis protein [Desulfovulcanus sp.]
MNIPIYQIDAFTSQVFAGNPAAVCLLENWLNTQTLQAIARENNVSETAFIIQKENCYEIRWFSPSVEVDLCGHATLASAFVIFNYIDTSTDKITFASSKSGELIVFRENDLLKMNFPSQPPKPCNPPKELFEALGIKPVEVLSSEDYLAVFQNEDEIISLKPNMEKLKQLNLRGVIVTAKGKKADFVSRFFAPKLGINEDPVTGSAHCTLIPYWKTKMGKKTFYAQQLSQRGGELYCEDCGDRVAISGKAVKFMQGTITI